MKMKLSNFQFSRIIFLDNYAWEHAVPFFVQAKCLSLSFLFFKHVSYKMCDIHEQSIPTNILSQLFTKTSTIHNYNTRSSSNECFCVKASKTERVKKSFARIGVSIWNSIPYSVKSLGTSKFQNKVIHSNTSWNFGAWKCMTMLKSLNWSITLAIYLSLEKHNNNFYFIYSFIFFWM